MVTEQLIWFIDSRFYYQPTSLDKMVQLAKFHQKTLKIIIDASKQITGRGYWYLLNNKESLSSELTASIETKKTQLINIFSKKSISAEVIINTTPDYLETLNNQFHDNDIVVIEESDTAKRHPIFQQLTEINAHVLLLNKKAWQNPVNLLAAVDPLHEHARPGKIDEHIVSITKSWAKNVNARWNIAHCCYVDSVLTKYKKNILSIHRENLNNFARKNQIPREQCLLLEGIPEDALASYIRQHKVNMIVIGLVTRNKLSQLWIGSTTTALLSNLPCDMLLIKQ